MKRFLLLAFLAAPALAQDAPPVKDYDLNLSRSEIAYIAKVLQTQPFQEVAPLLNKIQEQINEQDKPSPTPPKEPTVQ